MAPQRAAYFLGRALLLGEKAIKSVSYSVLRAPRPSGPTGLPACTFNLRLANDPLAIVGAFHAVLWFASGDERQLASYGVNPDRIGIMETKSEAYTISYRITMFHEGSFVLPASEAEPHPSTAVRSAGKIRPDRPASADSVGVLQIRQEFSPAMQAP